MGKKLPKWTFCTVIDRVPGRQSASAVIDGFIILKISVNLQVIPFYARLEAVATTN
jgi:hypothetical protein